MDYDIVDAGTRPRLQVQGGGQGQGGADEDRAESLNKVHAGICVSVGIAALAVGVSILAGPLQFVAVWLGLSLVLGPFAPPSVTGGDCRVGIGDPVLPDAETEAEAEEADSVDKIGAGGGRGRGHHHNSREKYNAPRQTVEVVNGSATEQNGGKSNATASVRRGEKGSSGDPVEEREWGSEDVDMLKKLMVKHPRGTLRRWEVIAEGLGGKHSVDSVVKMSKALGQKKGGDQDSYSRFLSQRKVTDVAIASPLSQRDDIGDPELNGADGQSDESISYNAAGSVVKGTWTEVEDKALLTALKTFPKDTPMRWDKVAVALPGRSKAECLRRFSDLRRSFRTTIGGGSARQEEPLKD